MVGALPAGVAVGETVDALVPSVGTSAHSPTGLSPFRSSSTSGLVPAVSDAPLGAFVRDFCGLKKREDKVLIY